jgi:hypothetical protein
MRRLLPAILFLLTLCASSRLCGDVYVRGSDMTGGAVAEVFGPTLLGTAMTGAVSSGAGDVVAQTVQMAGGERQAGHYDLKETTLVAAGGAVLAPVASKVASVIIDSVSSTTSTGVAAIDDAVAANAAAKAPPAPPSAPATNAPAAPPSPAPVTDTPQHQRPILQYYTVHFIAWNPLHRLPLMQQQSKVAEYYKERALDRLGVALVFQRQNPMLVRFQMRREALNLQRQLNRHPAWPHQR